jgi:hypothetical protein
MAKALRKVLMERDDLTEEEAVAEIRAGAQEVRDGRDPEEVLSTDFGLEPDWVLDLLEYVV